MSKRELHDPEYARTIFARIAAGEEPCHLVYEDEHVIAFLDTGAVAEGHTLVVPKEPAVTMDELSDDAAAALGRVLPRLCRAVKRVTGCEDYNLAQNNGRLASQTIFHVHVHIVPKPSRERGVRYHSVERRFDPVEGARLAAELRTAVAGGGE